MERRISSYSSMDSFALSCSSSTISRSSSPDNTTTITTNIPSTSSIKPVFIPDVCMDHFKLLAVGGTAGKSDSNQQDFFNLLSSTSLSEYTAENYGEFQPKYSSHPVAIAKNGSKLQGRLLFIQNKALLELLDQYHDESKSFYRMDIVVSQPKGQLDGVEFKRHYIDAYMYVWNANCIAGEWEYDTGS